jgi:serine protease Do
MKTCLRWLLGFVLLMHLTGVVRGADEVRTDEKGTFLGALFGTRDKTVAKPRGAVITHVLPDSPAARAKLRRNDVILEYGGQVVRDANHLAQLIRADKPDRKVQLTFLRDNRRRNVDVTLVLGPALKLASELPPPREESPEPPRLNKASVSVTATPLLSGKVKWTIEYRVPSGKKVVTCEGAAAELSSTLQKLPERERQLVRIALERLRALDKPRSMTAPRR